MSSAVRTRTGSAAVPVPGPFIAGTFAMVNPATGSVPFGTPARMDLVSYSSSR